MRINKEEKMIDKREPKTIRITSEVWKEVKRVALEAGVTAGELVETCILRELPQLTNLHPNRRKLV